VSIELCETIPDFTFPHFDDRSSSRCEFWASGAASPSESSALRYRRDVERVILVMRQRLNEPLSLQAMADIARLSPYYFNRVFRLLTGSTPCRFLSLLRMEAAKRLLMITNSSVSDVCFGVGYHSMGTFTREFRRLVGLPPTSLRHLVQEFSLSCSELPHGYQTRCHDGSAHSGGLDGYVFAPDNFVGTIFVGLFRTSIPQGRPAGCAILTAPGSYRITGVQDGAYYLFAAAFPGSDDPLTYLLPDQANLLVGATHHELLISEDTVNSNIDLTLGPLKLIDPPIVVALPLLIAEQLSTPELVASG
jgi:AraC family transcriptional regulator